MPSFSDTHTHAHTLSLTPIQTASSRELSSNCFLRVLSASFLQALFLNCFLGVLLNKVRQQLDHNIREGDGESAEIRTGTRFRDPAILHHCCKSLGGRVGLVRGNRWSLRLEYPKGVRQGKRGCGKDKHVKMQSIIYTHKKK